MLYTKHIINPSRVAKASDLSTGPYPIGMTVEKFLDLFADAKSIEGSGFSLIDNTLLAQFGTTDPVAALSNLNQAAGKGDTVSVFSGSSRRTISVVGQLTKTGAEPSVSATPTSLVNYPVHTIGGGSGSIQIDFGRTLCAADLLYPYILIRFSTGMGNTAPGQIVGNMVFEGFGSIPIRSGTAVSSFSAGFAGGTIRIKERYSSLRADSINVGKGTTLTFRPNAPMTDLARYKTAYFGPVRVVTQPTAQYITVTVPPNAKSGPVRFEADSPLYDSFLSYDEITISS